MELSITYFLCLIILLLVLIVLYNLIESIRHFLKAIFSTIVHLINSILKIRYRQKLANSNNKNNLAKEPF